MTTPSTTVADERLNPVTRSTRTFSLPFSSSLFFFYLFEEEESENQRQSVHIPNERTTIALDRTRNTLRDCFALPCLVLTAIKRQKRGGAYTYIPPTYFQSFLNVHQEEKKERRESCLYRGSRRDAGGCTRAQCRSLIRNCTKQLSNKTTTTASRMQRSSDLQIDKLKKPLLGEARLSGRLDYFGIQILKFNPFFFFA